MDALDVKEFRCFAAAIAMQGLLAGEGSIALLVSSEERAMLSQRSPEETADLAVRHADALIDRLGIGS